MFAGVFLRQVVPAGTHVGDRVKRQGIFVDDDALHHFVDDREDLAVHHHLGIRPDAAAVQKPAAQQHIGHDHARHECGETAVDACLPVRFLGAGGEGTHGERDVIKVRKHVGGCAEKIILGSAAGVAAQAQVGGSLRCRIKDRCAGISEL